jgi:hypothetical protein
MTVTHAHQLLAEALDMATEELDALILRRFAATRSIRAVEQPDGRWIAVTGEGRMLFPPADREVVERFVAAFVRREPRFHWRPPEPLTHTLPLEHSVRVPDNVVPIGGRADA